MQTPHAREKELLLFFNACFAGAVLNMAGENPRCPGPQSPRNSMLTPGIIEGARRGKKSGFSAEDERGGMMWEGTMREETGS